VTGKRENKGGQYGNISLSREGGQIESKKTKEERMVLLKEKQYQKIEKEVRQKRRMAVSAQDPGHL